MVTDDKISIIIPTYNREKLVVRSVESVLGQTLKNIEVIVVDDCSDDNTENVLKKIKDKRLKYIKLSKNSGACYARNQGIKNATGKYIAFQDSDDVFHPDKLEKQLNNLIKNKTDMDFCKVRINDLDVKNEFPTNQQELEMKDDFLKTLCRCNFISTQAILAKKKVFDDFLFDVELPRLQDYDFVLRVATKFKISYTDEVLVDLFRQSDSISNSNIKLKNACSIMIDKDYGLSKDYLKEFHTNLLSIIIMLETDPLNEQIKNLNYNFDILNNKYSELNKNFENLNKNFEELNNRYFSIVNSKRWKIINKFLNFFSR